MKKYSKLELDFLYTLLKNKDVDIEYAMVCILLVNENVIKEYISNQDNPPTILDINFTTPIYEHECDGCLFLGSYPKFGSGNDELMDYYECGGTLEMVLRYDNVVDHYHSFLTIEWEPNDLLAPLFNMFEIIKHNYRERTTKNES